MQKIIELKNACIQNSRDSYLYFLFFYFHDSMIKNFERMMSDDIIDIID